jgi:hypothetical protein
LPGGRLGDLEPFSNAEAVRWNFIRPLVFEDAGSRWVCWGANLTEAHSASASCQRTGGPTWFLPGAGQAAPIRCGGWLIARVGRDQRGIGVWSLKGKAVARRRYPWPPVVACAGAGAVVVGSRGVEIAQLPALHPRWSHPVRGRVSAVAALRDEVLYTTEDSTEVIGVRR